MAERRVVIGARIVSGTVAAGVAAVVIAGIAFLPLPTLGSTPRTITVDPAPADQLRVCPGAAVRVGDASGANADTAFTIGTATVDGEVLDGELERSRLTSVDPAGPASAAPALLRVPPGGTEALVAGAQLQDVDAPDFDGLTAAACAEPSGSTWLVGGATTVGRSTFLVLNNPTDVPSRVSLRIFGEDGPVTAPGMSGIEVPAGAQRVVSLAGFAPGVESPVVHVTARGGRIVAALQQSIVRGLDAVGVETTGAGTDPSDSLVIPGVRILDSVGVGRASALADWQDVGPVVRVAVPGESEGLVTVRVVPEGDTVGTSFSARVEPGTVADLPLDAGASLDEGGMVAGPDAPEGEEAHRLADGLYTVFVESDVPVVAGVRVTTAVDSGGVDSVADILLGGPESDFAWFAAAPALAGSELLVIPEGPSPMLSITNPTAAAVEIDLAAYDGSADAQTLSIPAGASTSVAISPGSHLLSGTEGLSVAVTFAAAGELAAFVLAPPRPVAGPVVVHPD